MKRRILCTMLVAMLILSTTACGSKNQSGDGATETPASTGSVTETPLESTPTAEVSPSPESEPTSEPTKSIAPKATQKTQNEGKENHVQLYIGADGSSKTYDYPLSGKVTAEKLISGIADMTGWNLELADKVTSEKGKMTVCFSKKSSLFTGIPKKQKKQFRVYDNEELIMSILDSVKQTLQNNFADSKSGNSSSLDIYFCGENNSQLEFSDIGKYVPLTKPYTELETTDSIPTGNLKGTYVGFSDTTTVEIEINGKSYSYAIEEEKVINRLSEIEEGSTITFTAKADDEIGVITKVGKK